MPLGACRPIRNWENNRLTAPLMRDNPGKPVSAPDLSETLTQYTIVIVLKFLTETSDLPSQSTSRV